jgi:hypothetical protein
LIVFENREFWKSATNPEPLRTPIEAGTGAMVLTEYSCVELGFPGTGNISSNPQFAFPGIGCGSLLVQPSSPCIDNGDPDPAYNDRCSIVAGSGTRNDIGAHGGLGNCGWQRRARPFGLAVHPDTVTELETLGSTHPRLAVFDVAGAYSGLPARLAIVGVNGLPWLPPSYTGIIDVAWSTGDWFASLPVPDNLSAASFTFVAASLDPTFKILISPPVTLTVR